ncbi:unnamed protein product [Chrysoparadoxa australica]
MSTDSTVCWEKDEDWSQWGVEQDDVAPGPGPKIHCFIPDGYELYDNYPSVYNSSFVGAGIMVCMSNSAAEKKRAWFPAMVVGKSKKHFNLSVSTPGDEKRQLLWKPQLSSIHWPPNDGANEAAVGSWFLIGPHIPASEEVWTEETKKTSRYFIHCLLQSRGKRPSYVTTKLRHRGATRTAGVLQTRARADSADVEAICSCYTLEGYASMTTDTCRNQFFTEAISCAISNRMKREALEKVNGDTRSHWGGAVHKYNQSEKRRKLEAKKSREALRELKAQAMEKGEVFETKAAGKKEKKQQGQKRTRCEGPPRVPKPRGGAAAWLEIGAGADAYLTRKVLERDHSSTILSLEVNPTSAQAARRVLRSDPGFNNRWVVTEGFSTKCPTPDGTIGAVLFEIFGFMASSEGVASTIRDIHYRYRLVPGAPHVPRCAATKMALVSLENGHFDQDKPSTKLYIGSNFILCKKFPFKKAMISDDVGTMEDFDFLGHVNVEQEHISVFNISKDGVLHGFAMWLVLGAEGLLVSAETGETRSRWPTSRYHPDFDDLWTSSNVNDTCYSSNWRNPVVLLPRMQDVKAGGKVQVTSHVYLSDPMPLYVLEVKVHTGVFKPGAIRPTVYSCEVKLEFKDLYPDFVKSR